MARLPRDFEEERREEVDSIINSYAIASSKAIYFSPGIVMAEYESRYGTKLQRDFVIRRYEANGIYYKNGLWVKEIE